MSRRPPQRSSRSAHPLAGRRVAVLNWRDLGHRLGGGAERYAWEAARALRDGGAEVTFVTGRERGQARRDRIDGIEIRRSGGDASRILATAGYLLRHRSRLDAVVDPQCGLPAFSPLFVGARTRVLLVVHHVHRDQFGRYFPRPVAALARWLERTVMPRVYRGSPTVAVSESTREEMRAQLGWSGPIDLLPNGTDLPHAVSAETATPDPERLVALGRLVPHKRVDVLVRAVAELAVRRPGVRLDLIGRGTERAALEELVAELGMAERIRFHGFVSDAEKAQLLGAAGLHVSASEVEGWGQVVLEAAAFGVPTVARDVPGLRDSIRDGETGWLLPEAGSAVPDEVLVPALADRLDAAIGELLDPQRAAATAQACRSWAAAFAWGRMHTSVRTVIGAEIATTLDTPVRPRRTAPSTPTPAPSVRVTERGM